MLTESKVCPRCEKKLVLNLSLNGLRAGKLFFGCSNYPKCKYTSAAVEVSCLGEKEERQRPDWMSENAWQFFILDHFIACGWGAHFTDLFENVIVSNLNNPKVLDAILKTEVIKNHGDPIIVSRFGAKIYYELFFWLMGVKSESIKKYLKEEFPEYYERFVMQARTNQK